MTGQNMFTGYGAGHVVINHARVSPQSTQFLMLSLALAQSGAVLAIGYSHGKAVFNGAEEVHFLDNREVCEKEGSNRWVS